MRLWDFPLSSALLRRPRKAGECVASEALLATQNRAAVREMASAGETGDRIGHSAPHMMSVRLEATQNGDSRPAILGLQLKRLSPDL